MSNPIDRSATSTPRSIAPTGNPPSTHEDRNTADIASQVLAPPTTNPVSSASEVSVLVQNLQKEAYDRNLDYFVPLLRVDYLDDPPASTARSSHSTDESDSENSNSFHSARTSPHPSSSDPTPANPAPQDTISSATDPQSPAASTSVSRGAPPADNDSAPPAAASPSSTNPQSPAASTPANQGAQPVPPLDLSSAPAASDTTSIIPAARDHDSARTDASDLSDSESSAIGNYDRQLELLVDKTPGLQLIDDSYLYDEKTGVLYRVIIRHKTPLVGEDRKEILTGLGKALSDAMEVSDSKMPDVVRADIKSVVFCPESQSIFCMTSSGLPIRLLSADTKRVLLPKEQIDSFTNNHATHKGLKAATNHALRILDEERDFYLKEIESAITAAKNKKQKDLIFALTLIRDLLAVTNFSYGQSFTHQQSAKIESAWGSIFRAKFLTGEKAPDYVERSVSSVVNYLKGAQNSSAYPLINALAKTLATSRTLHPELCGVIKIKQPPDQEDTIEGILSQAFAEIPNKKLLTIADFYKNGEDEGKITVGDLLVPKKPRSGEPKRLLSINHVPDSIKNSRKEKIMPLHLDRHIKFKGNGASRVVLSSETVIIENTDSAKPGQFFPEKFKIRSLQFTRDNTIILFYKKKDLIGQERWYQQTDNQSPSEVEWKNIQENTKHLDLKGVTLSSIPESTYPDTCEGYKPAKFPLEQQDSATVESFCAALSYSNIELSASDYTADQRTIFNASGDQPLLLSNEDLSEIAKNSESKIVLYESPSLNKNTDPLECKETTFSPDSEDENTPTFYLVREQAQTEHQRERVYLLSAALPP